MTPIEHCQFLTNKLLKGDVTNKLLKGGWRLTPADILALEAVIHGILAYLNEAIPAIEDRMAKLEALISKLPK